MKILVYGINYGPEWIGIGKFTTEFVEWLQRQGHEVCVVTAQPYYPNWRIQPGYAGWKYTKEFYQDAWVYRCPIWVPHKPNGWKRVLHLASFAFFSFPMVFWIALRFRPHLIYTIAPAFCCAPVALLVGRLISAKTWLHIQDFELNAALEMGLLRLAWLKKTIFWLEKATLQGFDWLSTISQKMLQQLQSKSEKPQTCLYLPNWANVATPYLMEPLSNPLRTELGISQDQYVLLYAGNFGEKQGLEIVIQAAQILSPKPELLFLLVGDGAIKAKIMASASHLPNVRFLPLQPPVRFQMILNLATLHLLPQRPETTNWVMPSKLLDILAVGGLVLATAYPDTELAQIVQAAGGFICNPQDPALLAHTIETIIPQDHTQRKHQARQYALDHLTQATSLMPLQKILQKQEVSE